MGEAVFSSGISSLFYLPLVWFREESCGTGFTCLLLITGKFDAICVCVSIQCVFK